MWRRWRGEGILTPPVRRTTRVLALAAAGAAAAATARTHRAADASSGGGTRDPARWAPIARSTSGGGKWQLPRLRRRRGRISPGKEAFIDPHVHVVLLPWLGGWEAGWVKQQQEATLIQ